MPTLFSCQMWLMVYTIAHALQLPDVADKQAMLDFLKLCKASTSNFHTSCKEKVKNTGNYTSPYDISQNFVKAYNRQQTDM